MAKIVMGYWDCSSCGQSVKGTLRSCPHCNNARGADVKFYTKDIEYLSPEEAEKIGTDPDWLCEYCGTYNNAKNTHCTGCGAVRGNDNTDYFENNTDTTRAKEKDESKWECAYCGAQNPQSASTCGNCKAARSEKVKEVEKPAEKPKRNSWLPLLFVLGFFGIIVLIALLTKPKLKGVSVDEIKWESTVHISEQQAKTGETADKSKIPENAESITTRTEKYTEKDVIRIDIETELVDLGNGAFEEREKEVKVYGDVEKERTIYQYVYLDWVVVDTKQSSGVGNKAGTPAYTTESYQKATERHLYKITVTLDNGEKETYKTDDDSIAALIEAGKKYTFKVNNDKKVLEVQ